MSDIFEKMQAYGCEELHFRLDPQSGLRAIVAINSTQLGDVTSGGVRLVEYASEDEALADVLRLSQAMTHKCAAIDAGLGGAKAVIWNRPQEKSPEMLRTFAKFVLDLGGRFRTAVDFGLTHEDGRIIKEICPYVEGESRAGDGFDAEADTTALGLVTAMKLAAQHVWGSPDLGARLVAVQGVGYVGRFLVEFLCQEGARVLAADVDPQALEWLAQQFPQVAVLPPGEIIQAPCDILAPCALGGIINQESIPGLRCRVICGAANNQLADPKGDSQALEARGILYLPDFIVNAGGIIQAVVEIAGGSKAQALERARELIGASVGRILERIALGGSTPQEIAEEMVRQKLATGRAA
jgi:glutamate dehydrogenase/leucine dehydrogenase